MWDCPSALILEKFWGLTKHVISVLGIKQNLTILREAFDSYIEKKKFCNLNVTFLANDPFFSRNLLRDIQMHS